MADVPQAITVNGATYTVPGSDTIEPLAASVSYNGTSAAGAFMPCLSIYSQDGHLISRTYPASAIAAGASGEVSFIPFVPPASGAASGGGIQYDVDNVGDWLAVETTGQGGPINAGVYFNDSGGGGIQFDEEKDNNNGVTWNIEGTANSGWRTHISGDGNNGGETHFVGGDGNNGFILTVADTNSNGIIIEDLSDGGIRIVTATSLTLTATGGGAGQYFTLQGIPSVNPGGTGRVWNNAGVLSIT